MKETTFTTQTTKTPHEVVFAANEEAIILDVTRVGPLTPETLEKRFNDIVTETALVEGIDQQNFFTMYAAKKSAIKGKKFVGSGISTHTFINVFSRNHATKFDELSSFINEMEEECKNEAGEPTPINKLLIAGKISITEELTPVTITTKERFTVMKPKKEGGKWIPQMQFDGKTVRTSNLFKETIFEDESITRKIESRCKKLELQEAFIALDPSTVEKEEIDTVGNEGAEGKEKK